MQPTQPMTPLQRMIAENQRRMAENERRSKERLAESERRRKDLLAKFLTPRVPTKPAPASVDPLAAFMAMPGGKKALTAYQFGEMLGRASRPTPTPTPKASAVEAPKPVVVEAPKPVVVESSPVALVERPQPSGMHPLVKILIGAAAVYTGYRLIQAYRDVEFSGRTLPKSFRDAMKLDHIEKNGEVCPCCGGYTPFERFVIDHIVPWVLGGRTSIANSQVLCWDCNSEKSSKVTLAERLRGRGGREGR